jgi:NAD-dependent dihydropyrimidine dehydrogenase PreA subunit
MDLGRIEEATGFEARFGPVRAGDIPAYLEAGTKKSEAMRRYRFELADRMDKLVAMNFVYWAPAAVVCAIFWPQHLVHLSALFWGVALAIYALLPWIPGGTGWMKALVVTLVVELGYVMAGRYLAGDPLAHWPWMIVAAALVSMIGMDLAGIASNVKSDAELFMHRLGIRSMGSFMKEKAIGTVELDPERCTGCLTCNELCPLAVFEKGRGKTRVARPGDCFSCGACVKQCPESALSIRE